jgi:hypothetical protein
MYIYSDFAFQTTGSEGAPLILLDEFEDLGNYELAEEFIANLKNWYDGVLCDDCAMSPIRYLVYSNENFEDPLRLEFEEHRGHAIGLLETPDKRSLNGINVSPFFCS